MTARKTILLYTDESTAGGVAHYNDSVLPALQAAGWHVFSAQPTNDSPMLVKQREQGIAQRFLSYEPRSAFARSFTDTTDPERILREVHPDVVLFSDCCPLSNIAAKHVAISRQVPFVSICHSGADYLAERFPVCLPVVRRQFAMAREVIAISQKNLEILRTHFGLTPDKGVVVPNGRSARFFAPPDPEVRRRLRAEIGVPADGVLCFTSARFDAAKGYQHQLAAIHRLATRHQLGSMYFAWAGTGELQGRFADLVTRAGLASRVHLLGQRWDIADWLDACDVFVLTTMLEGGLPLSVMEAMAKGVATIVTSVSGIAEIASGASRLLPDPNKQPESTVAELAEVLIELAGDAARRAVVASAGRALAEREFRLEANLTRTLALLEAAVPGRTTGEAAPGTLLPTQPTVPAIAVSAILALGAGDDAGLDTISELVGQTLWQLRRLEIIVVDRGMTAAQQVRMQELRRQHPQLEVLKSATGSTRYAAWNQGIAAARGACCTCMDPGTRFRPNALELMSLALSEQPEAALVYVDGQSEPPSTARSCSTSEESAWRHPDFLPPSVLLYHQFGPWRMWRRSVHAGIGLFDETLVSGGEYDFNLRFAQRLGAIHLPAVLGFCRPPCELPAAALVERYRNDSVVEALYARVGVVGATNQTKSLLHLDLGVRAMQYFPPGSSTRAASDPAFALRCFRRAAALDPSSPPAFHNLLWVLIASGARTEATALLEGPASLAAEPGLQEGLARLRSALAEGRPITDLPLMPSRLELPTELDLTGRQEAEPPRSGS